MAARGWAKAESWAPRKETLFAGGGWKDGCQSISYKKKKDRRKMYSTSQKWEKNQGSFSVGERHEKEEIRIY